MKLFTRLALFSFLLVTTAIRPAVAQSPEAIEEERAIGAVKAIQAGDADALLAYMNENWVPAQEGDDRLARWTRIAGTLTERHAGLNILGVEITEPYRLTIVAEDPEGVTLSFGFEFETQPPYRVLGMSIEAGGRGGGGGVELPPFELPPDADESTITATLAEWFTNLAQGDLFSGTALVAWHGKAIFTGAWGLASRDWNIPNQVDTRFDLGSINKSFTRIAIGQLALEGKLTFDDRIADHIPDFPNTKAAGTITIRHLLEHTSGLGDIFTDEFFRSSKALYRTPRDFFPLFADQPLHSEPGEKFAYSNAGFMVLGVIIEAVSWMPYDEYVAQHIFTPAGMTDAGFFAHDEPVSNVAVGYTRMGPEGPRDELRNNLFDLPIRGNSAGSAQATVTDLLHFDEALREHRLLPPAYTNWYFGGNEPQPGQQTETTGERARAATGIAGGAPGVSATLESDGDLTVIVLSNYDAPITEALARQLFRPLRRALGAGEE